MKSLSLAIIATISLGLFAASHATFAEDAASFAKIDVTYNPSTNILEITGLVYKTFSQNYVLTIFNPQGHLISVSQLHLSENDTFSQSIMAAGQLWSEPGNYTVKVASGPVVLSEQSSYFPGAPCCVKNSHGIQAGPQGTVNAIGSPLEQFRSGIMPKDVACNSGLQLVIKSQGGTPACVRPDTAQKLIDRGWAKETTVNAPIDSPAVNQTTHNELEIKLANQTYEAGYPVDGMLNFTTTASHCELPSFLVRSLSDQSIVFGPYPGWNYTNSNCADHSPFSFYAGLERNSLVTHDQKYSLEAAIYGKKYEKEVTVIPSEYSGKNLTAESNSVLPGFAPDFNCPPFLGSRSTDTILNSSGFGVYHRYYIRISHSEEVDDYLLNPGHNGTIVLKVHRGSAFPKDQDLADGLVFFNSQSSNGNFGHEGVTITFSPNPAIAGPDDYATFDITISATQDAARGTYWVYLHPGACSGEMPVFLTVGDKPLAQPPDLIGYDLSVDFSFSESPVLTVDVSNPSIHTFDNCSLTDAEKNETSILDTFETVPPGFSYKYNFDSNPVKGDRVAFECTNPHVIRTYSPS